jgi:hypothetical protein
MHSRQLEQVARQHAAELSTASAQSRRPSDRRPPARQIKRQTGWALVAIGLRIAESGNR